MTDWPSILCPVDFSEASRGALRYALAITEHFYGTLTVATVNDPLLAAGAALKYGQDWLTHESQRHLDAFVRETLRGRHAALADLNVAVATGKTAPQILCMGRDRHADLIVLSTHGLTGARELFLGSTTERLLRETTIPVLVTPAHAMGPESLEEARQAIRCVLAPIDLSDVSQMQIRIASGLADALGATLVVGHVLEPAAGHCGNASLMAHLDDSRRVQTESAIRDLLSTLPPHVTPSLIMASGSPVEEIPRFVSRCRANVLVMGLHASVGRGPRMGSVTYRVLRQTQALLLALPPDLLIGGGDRAVHRRSEEATSH